MPLPPYILDTDEAAEHYQATFARHDGSVAAPTASLHFTETLLQRLTDADIQQRYVTLHV
jgi:S-adenosylmethionine:tRNA ribosyltransferase-isomerase